MKAVRVITGTGVPLKRSDVDTDQIIPARFLKTTSKSGLGTVLFCDWRYLDEVPQIEAARAARPNAEFALNRAVNDGAKILLAGDNFGCGSSREHAPGLTQSLESTIRLRGLSRSLLFRPKTGTFGLSFSLVVGCHQFGKGIHE